MEKVTGISNTEIHKYLTTLVSFDHPNCILKKGECVSVFGIPKNGLILALRLIMIQYPGSALNHKDYAGLACVNNVEDANVILDDVFASGRTLIHFTKLNPSADVRVMFDKTDPKVAKLGWIKFPWERYEKYGEDVVTRTIEMIGDNPNRPGLLETPERVVRSWKELYSGYTIKDPGKLLERQFNLPGANDEMIIVKDIAVFSTCEHHLLPFYGTVAIGYIPNNNFVVGASKLPRLVDCFARRLQIQERLTHQIADAFVQVVQPKGFGLLMRCEHLCMRLRGCRQPNSTLVTKAMHGLFRSSDRVCDEFLSGIQ